MGSDGLGRLQVSALIELLDQKHGFRLCIRPGFYVVESFYAPCRMAHRILTSALLSEGLHLHTDQWPPTSPPEGIEPVWVYPLRR